MTSGSRIPEAGTAGDDGFGDDVTRPFVEVTALEGSGPSVSVLHPNVVPGLRFYTKNGQWRRVHNSPIGVRLGDRHAQYPMQWLAHDVAVLLTQVARAVDTAAQFGIGHRALSLYSITLTPTGELYVSGFEDRAEQPVEPVTALGDIAFRLLTADAARTIELGRIRGDLPVAAIEIVEQARGGARGGTPRGFAADFAAAIVDHVPNNQPLDELSNSDLVSPAPQEPAPEVTGFVAATDVQAPLGEVAVEQVIPANGGYTEGAEGFSGGVGGGYQESPLPNPALPTDSFQQSQVYGQPPAAGYGQPPTFDDTGAFESEVSRNRTRLLLALAAGIAIVVIIVVVLLVI